MVGDASQRRCKPEQLAALADALGVSVDYLLGCQSRPKRGTGPVGLREAGI